MVKSPFSHSALFGFMVFLRGFLAVSLN